MNLQRAEFLKGKFALHCKNYTDALYFFIRSAKKESIVLDGLIKKKSLKRIYKILIILSKKYNDYGIINWTMLDKIREYERTKFRQWSRKICLSININNIKENQSFQNKNTFEKELMIIENDIMSDIAEYKAKKTKDIIIIIDFNCYDQEEMNKSNSDKIDSFIDQTKTILEDYLSINDRLCVFIYKTHYKIISPLIEKNKIDTESFSKDFIYYKKSILNENEIDEEDSLNDLNENDLEKTKIEMKLEKENMTKSGSNESFQVEDKQMKIEDIIKGLIDSINYSNYYLRIKEAMNNEKYIILLTDIFNTFKMTDEIIKLNFNNLIGDKEITFLLVGRNKGNIIKNNNNESININEETNMIHIIKEKYGERSELIGYENMKKIKTILSSNIVINDEIIYPNEIYN